ncbi:hypothetical protein BOTBODRAFT_631481 [Botryobasidium botryosum FD-172 SS1]|uniref:Uncharacterized protein n=1 Tax=Botryobasidium botryosum (strain FD-172 SS1) TaxID=930990 RepID=A0A067MCC1_BOTB1|nr:hypothetical protein BOTBODRAFT_631481 [Botryobasidium botryosum FD-172 SS1]
MHGVLGKSIILLFVAQPRRLLARAWQVEGLNSVSTIKRSIRTGALPHLCRPVLCLCWEIKVPHLKIEGTCIVEVESERHRSFYFQYGAPETDLECLCNTVAYDLISACAFCQHKPFLTWVPIPLSLHTIADREHPLFRWSQWTACCEPSTTPLVGKFPRSIPNFTALPKYALWDPTPQGTFNPSAAKAFNSQESGGGGYDVGDCSSSNTAGGGGLSVLWIIIIICIVGLFVCFCMPRRSQTESDGVALPVAVAERALPGDPGIYK